MTKICTSKLKRKPFFKITQTCKLYLTESADYIYSRPTTCILLVRYLIQITVTSSTVVNTDIILRSACVASDEFRTVRGCTITDRDV